MIFTPFATPKGFINAIHGPEIKEDAFWFIFSGNQLLVHDEKRKVPTSLPLALKRNLYMGTLNNNHLFAGEAEPDEKAPLGWHWSRLDVLHGVLSDEHYSMAGRAMQLIEWDRSHTFCGCCGDKTFAKEEERCRVCFSCGHMAYPKIAPVIMVLVKKDKKILLARGPHFPEKFYSVLAGFVEPGETLEQCASREVFEEVGIKIKNMVYYGSQPWPFSGSLMVAFHCDWEEGEIKIDPVELLDAAWFDPNNLPQLPPLLSISRMLIDSQLMK